MISKPQIDQVVQAVMMTPQFQFLTDLMERHGGGMDSPDMMPGLDAGTDDGDDEGDLEDFDDIIQPMRQQDRNEYDREVSEKAVALHTQAVNAGKEGYSYRTARAAAAKMLGRPAPRQPRKPRPTAAQQYAAKVAKEAVRLHTREINAGRVGYSWSAAKAAAAKAIWGGR